MNTTVVGEATVIEMDARLDTNSAGGVEEAFAAFLDGGAARVVCDCSAMEYISSAGLRAMLMLRKRLAKSDGRLALCGLRPNVRDVFGLAGFLPIFEVCATREEALARVAE